jgi:hypothetical protein
LVEDIPTSSVGISEISTPSVAVFDGNTTGSGWFVAGNWQAVNISNPNNNPLSIILPFISSSIYFSRSSVVNLSVYKSIKLEISTPYGRYQNVMDKTDL